eukprot:713797-Rhodomonas_salina.1
MQRGRRSQLLYSVCESKYRKSMVATSQPTHWTPSVKKARILHAQVVSEMKLEPATTPQTPINWCKTRHQNGSWSEITRTPRMPLPPACGVRRQRSRPAPPIHVSRRAYL